jgi:hypothetical protein
MEGECMESRRLNKINDNIESMKTDNSNNNSNKKSMQGEN